MFDALVVFFFDRALYVMTYVPRPCCGHSVNLHGRSSPSVESVQIRPDSSKIDPNASVESVQIHPSVRTFVHTEFGTDENRNVTENPACQSFVNTSNNSKLC
jgi:hypothetical protein